MEEGALARVVGFGVIGGFLALLGLAVLFNGDGGCPTNLLTGPAPPTTEIVTCVPGNLPTPAAWIYVPLFIVSFCLLVSAAVTARDNREVY